MKLDTQNRQDTHLQSSCSYYIHLCLLQCDVNSISKKITTFLSKIEISGCNKYIVTISYFKWQYVTEDGIYSHLIESLNLDYFGISLQRVYFKYKRKYRIEHITQINRLLFSPKTIDNCCQWCSKDK